MDWLFSEKSKTASGSIVVDGAPAHSRDEALLGRLSKTGSVNNNKYYGSGTPYDVGKQMLDRGDYETLKQFVSEYGN